MGVRRQVDCALSPDHRLRAAQAQVAQASRRSLPVSRAHEARRVVAGDVGPQLGAADIVQPVADELAYGSEHVAAAKIGAGVAVVTVGLAWGQREVLVELGDVRALERHPGGAGHAALGIDGEEAEVAVPEAGAHQRGPRWPAPFAEQLHIEGRGEAHLEARRRLRARHGDVQVALEEGDAAYPN